jgi:hypothetical protein
MTWKGSIGPGCPEPVSYDPVIDASYWPGLDQLFAVACPYPAKKSCGFLLLS